MLSDGSKWNRNWNWTHGCNNSQNRKQMSINHLACLGHGWKNRLRPFSRDGWLMSNPHTVFDEHRSNQWIRGEDLQWMREIHGHEKVIKQKKTPPKAGFLDFSLGVLPSFHSAKKSSSQHNYVSQLALCQCSSTLGWLAQDWWNLLVPAAFKWRLDRFQASTVCFGSVKDAWLIRSE